MTTIYRIELDPDACDWLLPCDESFITSGQRLFDGAPKKANWSPPKFYFHHGAKPRTNFNIIAPGAITVDESALEDPYVCEHLEMAGELLPIELETGEAMYVLNVTEVVNAIDLERIEATMSDDKVSILRMLKYAFHDYRLTGCPIFKVPQTRRIEILTYAGRSVGPEDEFLFRYRRAGVTGLKFTELWTDGKPPPVGGPC